MNIDAQYAKQLSRQAYGGTPSIEGVEIKTLPFQRDDGGNFSELYRLNHGNIEGLAKPFEAKQISMSIVLPGAIKAYHLHEHQDDLWYAMPFHRLLVNLHDTRQDSPTRDKHMRFVLGGGHNLLVRIPAGVAHGVANVYKKPMMLVYATSTAFDINNPDEHRLPWDAFGKEIWEITKG